MTQIGIYFDQTRCTGCYTCMVACKDWYDINTGPVNLMRVKCFEHGAFPDLFAAYLASPCYHCENPPCIPACPEGAITKREADGIVVVDKDKCVGADRCPKKCFKACPWDVPQFEAETDAKMRKCEFCVERIEQGRAPICVEACPMFALDVGPLDRLKAQYGETTEAEGFKYFKRFAPSVLFKPKRKQ